VTIIGNDRSFQAYANETTTNIHPNTQTHAQEREKGILTPKTR